MLSRNGWRGKTEEKQIANTFLNKLQINLNIVHYTKSAVHMVRYSYYVPAKRAIIIIIIKLSPYGWTHNKRANGWLPVASHYDKYHKNHPTSIKINILSTYPQTLTQKIWIQVVVILLQLYIIPKLINLLAILERFIIFRRYFSRIDQITLKAG